MDYEEFPPPADFAGLVPCAWRLGGRGSGPAEPALPDGSPELIVSLADRFEQIAADGTVTVQPAVFLVGQITRPMVVRPAGVADLFAVRFEAHAAAMLHRPMSALTDAWIAVDDLPGAPFDGLLGRLAATRHPDERITLLFDSLRRAVRTAAPPDPRVVAAVDAVRTTHGTVPLDALSRRLRITPRTLQRLFLREVGVGPKLLARIARFQKVFVAWRDDPASLSRVAAECGYSDQSHLARDFRDFAGSPPAGFLSALPQFTGFLLSGDG